MINKYFFFFICFIFFLNTSKAEIIKNIEISGNKRIAKNTIIVLSDINIDSEYNEILLNNALKKLFESKFFKDVRMNFNNGLLEISVIENPIIENINIIGVKSNSLLELLEEKMILKNRMSYNENLLKQDINLIQNILKANGYYFAKIDSSLIKNDVLNSINIKLEVYQGEKAKIKKISFIGDKKLKDKKLLEVIASEEHKFWKFISKKVYLNQSTINLDKRLLENFYKNNGYYNVSIVNSFTQYNNFNGSFELIYNINSGKKYFFNNFKLNIPDDYSKNDFKSLNRIFDKLSGNRYSLNNINLILDEIDNIASSSLYEFLDSIIETNIIDENKLDFTFNIVESKKLYVDKINILGNYNTIEEVIRNKLIVDEGDPLNTLLFNKSIDNIKSLGFFKNVESEIKDGKNDRLKTIDIKVEEQPTGEISLAAGVGTSGSTIGGGIMEKNFLGKGINLNTNLELSEDGIKGAFIYSKPNFAYTDNTLFTSVSSTTKDFLADYGYKESDINFSVGTKFEQYNNLFFTPELDLSFENLKTNSNASSNLKKQEGSYQDLYFNYIFDYDKRNSSFNTSSGYVTSFGQNLPFVSDNNEITNTFVHTYYKKFSENSDMIGKTSLYLKAVNSIDGSDVRISKRLQIPYNRMRGFEKGKIGPVDNNNDYIGGNYVSALNFSLDLPEILSTFENIDFVYFLDMANVWGVDYDSSIDKSSLIRSATGFGMNILTPVGPLSFSFAKPITKKSSDKTESFRFNLGTTF